MVILYCDIYLRGLMTPRIAVYYRVSTTTQNIGLQRNDIKNYVKARGWKILCEYIDCASGSTESRESLNQLMDDARKRKFDVVLVWRFDRFARSSKHLVNALSEFNSLGINFVSYCENIDLSTPMGKAMFTIIAAMAELERNMIRERVLSGLDAARKKGTRLGRPMNRDDSKILNLRSLGMSIRKIAMQRYFSQALEATFEKIASENKLS